VSTTLGYFINQGLQLRSLWDPEDGFVSEEPDDDTKKEKKVFSRSVSVGGADGGNSLKSSNSSNDSKNRKRNSSYEQSMADDAKDGCGDFHSRPSPALEKVNAFFRFFISQIFQN
jgi:hypothetical protein